MNKLLFDAVHVVIVALGSYYLTGFMEHYVPTDGDHTKYLWTRGVFSAVIFLAIISGFCKFYIFRV